MENLDCRIRENDEIDLYVMSEKPLSTPVMLPVVSVQMPKNFFSLSRPQRAILFMTSVKTVNPEVQNNFNELGKFELDYQF